MFRFFVLVIYCSFFCLSVSTSVFAQTSSLEFEPLSAGGGEQSSVVEGYGPENVNDNDVSSE